VPPAVVRALLAQPRPACAYVYDTGTLRRAVADVRAALPPGTLLLYAVKANSHPGVVAALAPHVDGLEVASGGELRLAASNRTPTIVFGGPAKTDAELASAVATGALVHAESLLELRRLALVAGGDRSAAVAGSAGVRVALRVNRAGVGLAGSHRMSGLPTPFGLDEAALDEAVALARDLPALRLVGFHLHAVSNNLDAAAHADYVADALDWSVAAACRLGVPLEYVNVGGGLGVDYTGDKRFDLDALHAGLAGVRPPDGVRLAFEPGRFLVAGAGWYAAEVLDLKRTHGRWFAVLRGGTHHFRLPAAWGHSHPAAVLPVEEWPYPFTRPEVRDARVDVVGELCTPRDVLARDLPVERLRVGDVMVFGNAGGYGWDISHHDFLRHPYPQIVLIGH
jgi:diaminopimelate decarboxylase